MKKSTVLFLSIIIPVLGICQSQYSARISLGSANIGVSPSEELWVTTKAGSLLYTDKIGHLWSHIPIGNKPNDNTSIGGLYERVTVFSNDTLMISGFIHGKQSNTDFVLWSGDKGKRWEEVVFGKASWLDSFCNTDDGRAWMSGSTEFIYYTKDFGKTWVQIDKSRLIGNIRLISAATSPDGELLLFGASWGEFYMTKDNCITLTPIPTPYSQGKYKFSYSHKRDPNKRPDISKIRVYGDRYLITQDGRVFITMADSIDWQPLKDAYDYEHTKAGDLYVIKKDGQVQLYDKDFVVRWTSSQKMSQLPQSVTCQNESLFAIGRDEVYKVNPKEFIVSELFTDDFTIGGEFDEFLYKGSQFTYAGNTFAYEGKDLLCREVYSARWYRLMTVDFKIGNAVVFENNLLISDTSFDKYYKVDVNKKAIAEYVLPDDFIRAGNNPVVGFVLETGSQGCFHNNVSVASYKRKDDLFLRERAGDGLRKIDAGVIDHLVEAIIESRNNTVSVSDLLLTESDIVNFKEHIKKEAERAIKENQSLETYENPYRFPDFDTDFGFYLNMADSLYAGTISDSVINAALRSEYGNWSTTTDWKSIVIEFRNGQKLKITNSDDKPNYMLTPWLVNCEGVKFKGNSLLIGRLLTELSDGNFIASPFKDKNYLIFNIINYLYQLKLADYQ